MHTRPSQLPVSIVVTKQKSHLGRRRACFDVGRLELWLRLIAGQLHRLRLLLAADVKDSDKHRLVAISASDGVFTRERSVLIDVYDCDDTQLAQISMNVPPRTTSSYGLCAVGTTAHTGTNIR